jgi:hypothetical protein
VRLMVGVLVSPVAIFVARSGILGLAVVFAPPRRVVRQRGWVRGESTEPSLVRESLDGLAAYVVPGADAFSRWGEASQCSVSSTSWWTTIVGKVSSFVYTVHSRPMPEPDRRDRSHAIRTKNHPSVSKSRWRSACSVITERPCRPAHPDDQPAAVASATAVSRARALPETWRVHQSRALDRVDRALRKLPPGARIRIAREPESISQREMPAIPEHPRPHRAVEQTHTAPNPMVCIN